MVNYYLKSMNYVFNSKLLAYLHLKLYQSVYKAKGHLLRTLVSITHSYPTKGITIYIIFQEYKIIIAS